MENKHTPGPWYRNIHANGKYPIVFAGRNQHIAVAKQQNDGAETEANIDLIAAAPDMFEVIKELYEYGMSSGIKGQWFPKVEAAYLKATGN